MDTNRIAHTSQHLSRSIAHIHLLLDHVPRSAFDQREALHELHDSTVNVWADWVEHCDTIDEALNAVTYVLGQGVEEVLDVGSYADAEFDALRSFEREIQLAMRDAEAGFSVDRSRLYELYERLAAGDDMRQLAERRVISAYGAIAFVADTW